MQRSQMVGSVLTHAGPVEVRIKNGDYGSRCCILSLVHIEKDGSSRAAAQISFVDPAEAESVSMALADASHLMRLP